MRLRRARIGFLAALVALALAGSACGTAVASAPAVAGKPAQTVDAGPAGARTLLQALYAEVVPDGADDIDALLSRHGSRALVTALTADREATPPGEVGRLDFDPFSDSQDPEIRRVVVGMPVSGRADACQIDVRFDNAGTPTRIRFMLVRENGTWKIDDMLALGADDRPRWRLIDILAAPAAPSSP